MLTGLELAGHKLLGLVALSKCGQFIFALIKARAAFLLLFLRAADVHVPFELLVTRVNPDLGVFVQGEADATECGKVLGVFRNLDQLFRVFVRRQREVPFLPDLRDVGPPAVLHSLDVGIRSTEQQHYRAQRVAAREHGKVLLDDGLEKRSHQLIGWHTALL